MLVRHAYRNNHGATTPRPARSPAARASGPTLELGCGPGHLQQQLAESGMPVYGIDASPFMIRRSRRRADRNGYAFQLLRADARRLPFANRCFDTVMATFPSDYI
ncbi:MAG TPA: class I SAM-dependent methyltransferase, partial [Roseiflexaceae bacterium]|nr:class I SAM-dependent methyltransferase [Roseiflexaceae bacterium]